MAVTRFPHAILAGILLAGAAAAQPQSRFRSPAGRPGGGDGPWSHRVLLATSPDGLAWTVESQSLVEPASVPELFLAPDGAPIVVFVDAGGGRHGFGAVKRGADGSWLMAVKSFMGGAPQAGPHAGRGPRGNAYRAAFTAGAPAPMRLMIAVSPDGLTFERRNLIVTDQGAVPDLVVDERGWIRLYYQSASVGADMNRVALALSKDGGTSWTFRRVSLSGFAAPKPDLCDPEIQLLDDGTFRLYLTWIAPGQRHATTYLTESRDGVNFRLAGRAFDPDGPALDPSIVKIGATRHSLAQRIASKAASHMARIFSVGTSVCSTWQGARI